MGNCVIPLGIELGLTVDKIEEVMYRNPKDLYAQNAHVLRIWKTTSRTPTVSVLLTALVHVQSGGLQYLFNKYNVVSGEF